MITRLSECTLVYSAGKDCVARLLDKDDRTRLGSKSGASEVKQHSWFAKINWGLLRNTRPPIVPSSSKGQDAENFREMKESNSLHLDDQRQGVGGVTGTGGAGFTVDDEEFECAAQNGDLFGAFSSVTLHYDGDN